MVPLVPRCTTGYQLSSLRLDKGASLKASRKFPLDMRAEYTQPPATNAEECSLAGQPA